MLYHLLYPLHNIFSGFNVFKYITFRSSGAALTALIVSFVLGPSMIAWLRKLKVGQHVRAVGGDSRSAGWQRREPGHTHPTIVVPCPSCARTKDKGLADCVD